MKTIAFPGKGGSGKTTTTSNLAVVACRQGLRVGLIDLDPQGSLRDWRRARGAADIPARSCRAEQLQDMLVHGERARLDWLLIDMPPAFGAHTLSIVNAVDFVLLPMRPTILDLGVTRRWIDLLRSAARPFGVLINAAPPRRQGEDAPAVRDARAALRSIGSPLWQRQITNRLVIPYSAIGGRGVAETEPAGPAAAEYSALWRSIAHTTTTTTMRRIHHGSSTAHAA